MLNRSHKVFYGWWIVIASFFIMLYAGGVIIYGFTAFFEPIADDLGWSYMQISLAASLRGLELGLFAPLTGMLTDRWGPRRLIFGGIVITAAGLIILGNTTSLGMFYGAFALTAIGISACTVTVLMTALANWFRRKSGIASGIAMCGFGFSGLLVPVIVILIEVYGWHTASIILGLGMLAILPLSLLFRHKPEQYGYLPDGQLRNPITYNNDLPQVTRVKVGMKQALKSGTFWRLTLSFTYWSMVVSAAITHVMPCLSTVSVTRSMSSLVVVAITLISIGGRLGFGWLGDKLDRKLVAAVGFTMMGFGLLCFGYTSTGTIWLVPFLVLFGIGYGGGSALRPSLVREYFGRSSFGAIFGLMAGINMLGNVIGPTAAGWVYDNWGSYQAIWLVFGGLAIVAVISTLTIRPVSKGEDRNR